MRRCLAIVVMSVVAFSATADHHENPVRELVKRFFAEVVNTGDMDAIPTFVSEEYINHSLPPEAPQGIEGVKGFVGIFRAGFPDLVVTPEQVLVEADKAVVFAVANGTNSGPFMAMPATDRAIHIAFIDIYRVEDGKIVESWTAADELTMMGQLGVMPRMPSGTPLEASTNALQAIGESSPSAEKMKEIARDLVMNVWTAGGASAIERLYSDDYVNYSPGVPPNMRRGLPAVKIAISMIRTGFPDIAATAEDVIVEGDLMATRWTAAGTHTGEFIVPATGKSVEMRGVSIYRVKAGKVIAEWGIQDMAGLARQLGFTPESGG